MIKIDVGISNRHCHLTKEDFIQLFGKEEYTVRSSLRQPGEVATEETVTIRNGDKVITPVRVLAPFREYTQVELSETEYRKLKIKAPIRDSGDVLNSALLTIEGPSASITKECGIIATRHIHLTREIKEELGLGETVTVYVDSEKPTMLLNVSLREKEGSFFEIHLDIDDGNAAKITEKTDVYILKD